MCPSSLFAFSFLAVLASGAVGANPPKLGQAQERALRAQDRTHQAQTWSHAIQDSAGILYSPLAGDFRPRYEEDEANNARQSWGEYWKWVLTFYSGNLLARGWTRECENILERVQQSEQRIQLMTKMSILGRLVAAEWAKDNSVRRIGSRDVRQWRSWLREAAGRGRITNIQSLLDVLGRIEIHVIRATISAFQAS